MKVMTASIKVTVPSMRGMVASGVGMVPSGEVLVPSMRGMVASGVGMVPSGVGMVPSMRGLAASLPPQGKAETTMVERDK